MEHAMELDELKATWQALDRRLQQWNTIDLLYLKDRQRKRVRTTLRPLYVGQVFQLVFGLCMLCMGVAYWTQHRGEPLLMSMGVIIHAYGVLCIILSGATLGMIGKIDPARAVVEVQRKLATLRRFYIINGMVTGLSWWLLWMPATTVVFGLLGADQSMLTPGLFIPGTVLGILGLLGTWWFHRWSRRPQRPRLARAMERAVTGKSLVNAQHLLDEIAAFERE